MNIHTIFDLSATCFASLLSGLVWRWRLANHAHPVIAAGRPAYALCVIAGAVLGGYGFGTLNLYLSGVDGIGRSILGALFGAILAVETYKAVTDTRGSTGLIFVFGFAMLVCWGRLGCFFSGLEDHTHGTVTRLPWGVDYGDGLKRHPVQLYESLAMALFLIGAGLAMIRPNPYFIRHGFYMMVAWYAGQRFVWEFIKPYQTVLGPLNVFHFVCICLLAYAFFMIAKESHVRPQGSAL